MHINVKKTYQFKTQRYGSVAAAVVSRTLSLVQRRYNNSFLPLTAEMAAGEGCVSLTSTVFD